MGMDLIGAGFTRNSAVECKIDLIDVAIDLIPDASLEDETYLNLIDPAGNFDTVEPEEIRDYLKSGAREYDSAVSGHRMAISYYINGTPLEFVWAGGGSWGDDPFDGFTELCYFTNFAEVDEGIAQLAGYVCGGLPNATTIAEYATGA
jgi:hypothetical protein